jgi:DNA-binding NarL/FixJ family response regulator
MASLLGDRDIEVEISEGLSDWTPHQEGSCIVLGIGSGEDVALLRAFHEDHPFTPVVAVSDQVDISTFAHMIRSGATALVAESESAEDLHQVIMAALGGRVCISLDVAHRLAALVPNEEDWARWVSETEVEWLRAMASGQTVLDLAEEVGYSERAMFRYLKTMYARIGARNRTEALLWASQRGLLGAEGQSAP